MELRVLHAVAHKKTWYGRWGYTFGRAGFNLSPGAWEAAASALHDAPLKSLVRDFRSVDPAIVRIIERYQVSLHPPPPPTPVHTYTLTHTDILVPNTTHPGNLYSHHVVDVYGNLLQ